MRSERAQVGSSLFMSLRPESRWAIGELREALPRERAKPSGQDRPGSTSVPETSEGASGEEMAVLEANRTRVAAVRAALEAARSSRARVHVKGVHGWWNAGHVVRFVRDAKGDERVELQVGAKLHSIKVTSVKSVKPCRRDQEAGDARPSSQGARVEEAMVRVRDQVVDAMARRWRVRLEVASGVFIVGFPVQASAVVCVVQGRGGGRATVRYRDVRAVQMLGANPMHMRREP